MVAATEATTLFNLSRLYGSTMGIATVQISIYCNTQAMHLALAKQLTPNRVTGYVFQSGIQARARHAQ